MYVCLYACMYVYVCLYACMHVYTHSLIAPVMNKSSSVVVQSLQAMLNILFEVSVPYVPYTSVPARSSVASCQVVPGVRRTSAH